MNLPIVVQVLKKHGKVRNLLEMLLTVANKLIRAIRGWKGDFQKLKMKYLRIRILTTSLVMTSSTVASVFNTLNRE